MASSRDQSGALSGSRRSVPSGRTSYQLPRLRRRLTKVVSLFTFARLPRRDDADDIVVSLHIHNEKHLAAPSRDERDARYYILAAHPGKTRRFKPDKLAV